MTLTLLLDLDDTLLDTHMESFIPAYFQALSGYLAGRVKPEVMLPALVSGTRLMMASDDPTRTLKEVFDAEFFPKLGMDRAALQSDIEKFYDETFPTLGNLTQPRPEAVPLVEWALKQGYRVVVATDPLFPRKATLHRLRWAGLDPEKYSFELISSYETFHFTKTHPSYYAEVLARLGWPDGPALMVGNDLERDLAPARTLGLPVYWIENGAPPSSSLASAAGTGAGGTGASGPEAAGRGKLADLRAWLESADLRSLKLSLHTPEAFTALMSATPAALSSLLNALPDSSWAREPTPEDWALIEIVCHLRDTEREIHHMQAKLLLEQTEPFIPRPDAGVWAKQRKYLKEDGPAALREFALARLETLAALKRLGPDDWARKARHAIFGPTNFQEVVGFMAEHDCLHIQQAWRTLHAA